MKQIIILICLFELFTSNAGAQSTPHPENVELVLRVLKLVCVDGSVTQKITVTQSSGSTVSVGGVSSTKSALVSEVKLDNNDIEGLIVGVDNTISPLAAQQADKARECMRPYLKTIITHIWPTTDKVAGTSPPPKSAGNASASSKKVPPHYTLDANGCLHRTPHGFFLGLPHIACKTARYGGKR